MYVTVLIVALSSITFFRATAQGCQQEDLPVYAGSSWSCDDSASYLVGTVCTLIPNADTSCSWGGSLTCQDVDGGMVWVGGIDDGSSGTPSIQFLKDGPVLLEDLYVGKVVLDDSYEVEFKITPLGGNDGFRQVFQVGGENVEGRLGVWLFEGNRMHLVFTGKDLDGGDEDPNDTCQSPNPLETGVESTIRWTIARNWARLYVDDILVCERIGRVAVFDANANPVYIGAAPSGDKETANALFGNLIFRDTPDVFCLRDCQLSEWGEWGECNARCGGGTRTRSTTIDVAPAWGGSGCGLTEEQMACNLYPCDCEEPTAFEGGSWDCTNPSAYDTLAGSHHWSTCQVLPADEDTVCNFDTPITCDKGIWTSPDEMVRPYPEFDPHPVQPLVPARRWGLVNLGSSYAFSFTIIPRGLRWHWSNIFEIGDNRELGVGFHPGSTQLYLRYGTATMMGYNALWNDGCDQLTGFQLPMDVMSYIRFETISGRGRLYINNALVCEQTGREAIFDSKFNEVYLGNSVLSHSESADADMGELQFANIVTVDCHRDCQQTPWSEWTECSKVCGTGSQTRERATVVVDAFGGTECGESSQNQDCNTNGCSCAAQVVIGFDFTFAGGDGRSGVQLEREFRQARAFLDQVEKTVHPQSLRIGIQHIGETTTTMEISVQDDDSTAEDLYDHMNARLQTARQDDIDSDKTDILGFFTQALADLGCVGSANRRALCSNDRQQFIILHSDFRIPRMGRRQRNRYIRDIKTFLDFADAPSVLCIRPNTWLPKSQKILQDQVCSVVWTYEEGNFEEKDIQTVGLEVANAVCPRREDVPFVQSNNPCFDVKTPEECAAVRANSDGTPVTNGRRLKRRRRRRGGKNGFPFCNWVNDGTTRQCLPRSQYINLFQDTLFNSVSDIQTSAIPNDPCFGITKGRSCTRKRARINGRRVKVCTYNGDTGLCDLRQDMIPFYSWVPAPTLDPGLGPIPPPTVWPKPPPTLGPK